MSRLVRVGSLDFNRLLLTACTSPGVPNYPVLLHSIPPRSHSIVRSYVNALIYQRKFFPRVSKDRLPDPSKICALDSKQEFQRSAICSVSVTIGIDRSIFQ
jgi:hypothetical protein